MRNFQPAFILCLLAVTTSTVIAQQQESDEGLKVASIFGNGMVLQQQSSAAIWGKAKPNSEVSIRASWQKKPTVTTANDAGKWLTRIETPEAGGPFTLEVRSGQAKKRFQDVLAGEVWICSGQSNMHWKMRGFGADHFKEDVEKANYPNIRFCELPKILALEPQDDIKAKWTKCKPATALNFSCVAYFFGSRLHQELDVPIGLISTSWGGSSAEAWVNGETLEAEFPQFKKSLGRFDSLIAEHGPVHRNGKNKPKGLNQRMPAVLYNKMIRPIVPFAIRGVIWYQGESNVARPVRYRKLFPTLIKNWRQEWGQGDFPFYYVQIAPFDYRQEKLPAAMLREAQFQALSVPKTGMVVTMDIGNATNIHPKQKKPVGERLARLALAKDYGRTDLVYSGPEYAGHEIESNQVRLRFNHVGGGLASRDGQPLSHFLIAGKDRVFHPAEAVVDGDTILVQSTKVKNPASVRFGWGNGDAPNLMNKEGLPTSSFRTDDWEIKPSKPQPRKRAKKAA